MSEPHDAWASERVTADELANFMAGALTRSEEEELARRIEKDPQAPDLLDRMANVDEVFRAAYPVAGPPSRAADTMPLQRAARIHADLAGEALSRFDTDHLRSTPYAPSPGEDDGDEGTPEPDARVTVPASPVSTPEGFSVEGVDFDSPNAARMYDYFLGGSHNFPVDREQAEQVIAASPTTRAGARANRVFLGNAVRWCLAHGVTQFLDLGSGVPTAGNVHEVAHAIDPAARIAYVDFEPVAVAHARQLIGELHTPDVTVTRADMREPRTVLTAPGVAGLLDFSRPVAVLMVAVLHFVDEDGDALDRTIQRYLDALVPGSVLVLGHASDDQDDVEFGDQLRSILEVYRHSANTMTFRSRARIRELLSGLDIVEPGLVDTADWPTPGTTPGPAGGYGAVAVVPERRHTRL